MAGRTPKTQFNTLVLIDSQLILNINAVTINNHELLCKYETNDVTKFNNSTPIANDTN